MYVDDFDRKFKRKLASCAFFSSRETREAAIAAMGKVVADSAAAKNYKCTHMLTRGKCKGEHCGRKTMDMMSTKCLNHRNLHHDLLYPILLEIPPELLLNEIEKSKSK